MILMIPYQLKCLMRELMLVMDKQNNTATVNLVTLSFQLTLLLLSMYHAIDIISLFPKLILLCSYRIAQY